MGQIAALCATIILFFTMAPAAMRGSSDVATYLLEDHLNSWATSSQPPANPAWEKANGFFQTAITLTPTNPRLLQNGGLLYEWRAEIDKDKPSLRDKYADQSIEYYRASTKRRPAWPYAWMNLAVALAQTGRLDAEFQHAFSTALTLGPWEPDIQFNITRLGFETWTDLSRGNRKRLLVNIQNAASQQPKKILELAEEQGRLLIVCYGVKGNQKISDYCRRKGMG